MHEIDDNDYWERNAPTFLLASGLFFIVLLVGAALLLGGWFAAAGTAFVGFGLIGKYLYDYLR